MTAISHLLPIILNACEFKNDDQILRATVSQLIVPFKLKKPPFKNL